MSYDICLRDPVTKETLIMNSPHFMTGGTYAIGGTREFWINITYNYARYYYEATEGDHRFAHEEVSAYYSDGTQGPVQTEYGIRGIYGKTGAESIPMIKDMIARIEKKYQCDGEWIDTDRVKVRFCDQDGNEYKDYISAIIHGQPYTKEEYTITVNEGPNEDYWEVTAGNAIKPLWQLIALAEMRPDGVWDGD